ncbi:MAG: LamG-like jellyroll fold domain-containing protein [Isosphaeraceae bacterium]
MQPFSCPSRLILRALLGSALLLAGTSSARAGLQTGLQAYYHMNGNGLDSSGNGLNLNLVGNPSFGTGLYGQALSLHNDSSQYATLSSDPSAFNLGSSNFTIQVWVNFNTFGSREQTLIEKFSGSGGPGWTLTTPNDNIQFYASGVGVVNSAQVSMPTDAWNQIIVERNGSTLSIYLDGSLLVSDTSFVGSINPSTNPLLIGTRDAQDGRDFAVDGRMDEIAIWDRALTTSEIASLWNNGQGMLMSSVPEPSSLMLAGLGLLVGCCHWRCRKAKMGQRRKWDTKAKMGHNE